MRDRYFGSRVKRLFREKGWSMAEFSRRTTIGRSVLKRIMETRGWDYCVTHQQIVCIATAFNVTVEYLESGRTTAAVPPSATVSQWEISRLRAEMDRLRRRRGEPTHMEGTIARARVATQEESDTPLLDYATQKKLEIRISHTGKYVVVSEREYEIAEADTMRRALEIALASDVLVDRRNA